MQKRTDEMVMKREVKRKKVKTTQIKLGPTTTSPVFSEQHVQMRSEIRCMEAILTQYLQTRGMSARINISSPKDMTSPIAVDD